MLHERAASSAAPPVPTTTATLRRSVGDFLFDTLTGTSADERGRVGADALSGVTAAARRRSQFRLHTLLRLRWAAVAGQTITILLVRFLFDFRFPWLPCLLLVGAAAAVNLLLVRLGEGRARGRRVPEETVFFVLAFDTAQLGLLIFFTGGMTNPFAIFIMGPVMAASTTMSADRIWRLGALAALFVTLVAFWYVPLPWYEEPGQVLPRLYVAGHWTAVVVMIAFTVSYAYRAADEGRKLAGALAATELVLQREQHLSALDGLAAAAAHELGTPLATIATAAGEMERELDPLDPLRDEVALIRAQARRCREILGRLSAMGTEGDAHLAAVAPSALLEDVAAPHRGFGVRVETAVSGLGANEPEPLVARHPGLVYGLGNLIENAVDFARERVTVSTRWTPDTLAIVVEDDGPGFSAEVLERLGEPFVSRRGPPRHVSARRGDGATGRRKKGLGLGVFIAKTLLERTGAAVSFNNAPGEGDGGGGARVTVAWSRDAIVRPDAVMAPKAEPPSGLPRQEARGGPPRQQAPPPNGSG